MTMNMNEIICKFKSMPVSLSSAVHAKIDQYLISRFFCVYFHYFVFGKPFKLNRFKQEKGLYLIWEMLDFHHFNLIYYLNGFLSFWCAWFFVVNF